MITLLQSPISADPNVMGGTLVFKNTRVPAQSLLEYLDDRLSVDEFLDNFLSINRADAVNFLKLARDI